MGGEKYALAAARRCSRGSPPHGRGKVAGDEIPGDVLGITPAQAGKSKLALCTPSCPTDHPRVGGEKSTFLNSMSFPPGSPPRRRGKVPNARCFIERQRITPAWAGKSAFRFQSQKASQDHPRVGGEKLGRMAVAISVIGSPPRGRGKEGGPLLLTDVPWITPAWAGKRFQSASGLKSDRDHPRMGGEKIWPISA